MATSASTSAPRRTTRSRQAVASPPPKRTTVGASRPPPRFPTPSRQNLGHAPFGARTASVASAMDIDEANSAFTERTVARLSGSTVFAKSEELTVTFYAHLPMEVKQVLKSADFYGDSYTGEIDTLTGFALVASSRTCFVWQHAQAVKGTPTCYIFSCPQEPNAPQASPFHAFVPFGTEREPGLILVSVHGEVRFWDSIGIGLAGGANYSTSELDLGEGEQVTKFIRSDVKTYLVATSVGTHFRLTLTSTGGKYHLEVHRFAGAARGMSITRLLPNFLTSSRSPLINSEPGNTNALAFGSQTHPGSWELWSLVDARVQKWNVSSEGWEEILLDEYLDSIVLSALRSSYGDTLESDDSSLDLEFLDLAVDRFDRLILLISYVDEKASRHLGVDLSGVHRTHALVRLGYTDGGFSVENIKSIPHQRVRWGFTLPVHPRIYLIKGGELTAIQFGEVVILCSQDSGFQDRLQLASTTDRTLGLGVSSTDNSILILSASVMVRATLNLDKISTFDPETGYADLVKSTLTQAILYGSLPENPLSFSFSPEIEEESLMQGAEKISHAVLESDPELIRKDHDLTAQLNSRKERLSWLIRFINDNGVLVKMSQRSRQSLAIDAEKLYACDQLWKEHNNYLVTSPIYSVLQDSIDSFMSLIHDVEHEDIARAFFRAKVSDVGKLLRKVVEIAEHMAEQSGRKLETLLPESNRIVLTILGSALEYRRHNWGVYGLEAPMIKPWTSQPGVIEVVLELFESTTRAVDSNENGHSQERRQNAPGSQLPDLASILFACIQERLDWLRSPLAAEESGVDRDREGFEQKFALLRPEVLETLRRTGHGDAAFALAEQYRDFSSLAALCHKDVVYPPERNPNAAKIQNYLDRFKDEFATELFRWYIQHGELRILFAQGGRHYEQYLDEFFTRNPHHNISWLHDLGKARFNSAAASLLHESKHAKDLEAKHLMLSIGKLSHLAQLHETRASPDENVLDAFHDGLDFVSVQEAVYEEFLSVTQSLRGKQSLETQIDAVVRSRASTLSDRKALLQIFKNLVRSVLQKKALCVEDMVDVLTLKDNATTTEDYATALHLLARTTVCPNIPDSRKVSAFRSVWRRIYLHDDWEMIRKTANVTDVELNQRFQSTALFATLCSVLMREDQPEGYETTPDVALIVPSPTEITSRWPGTAPEHVDALIEDYNMECDRLGDLDLNDVYHRIRELAAQQIIWQESM
ncbi:hypothetical protein BDN72DRAFT_755585 [Pluteus cervinus]|uniref:Uncharacterized protein n=1 Tax=Pluteus cervinus TaxID=181527 RepID=A0ACD3BFF7_9AGAR|nr:hypothetical protein BDN72DRAFT_755585 [Pluteus cervinus]